MSTAALSTGRPKGFVKIHVKKGTDQIMGATIVGSHAGDMISEITVAMHGGMGLGKPASVIHPYPTAAEASRVKREVVGDDCEPLTAQAVASHGFAAGRKRWPEIGLLFKSTLW
jgi:hypothetical protein